jgi:hypothetical protein
VAVGVMTNDIMRHFDRAREGLSTADVRCTRSVVHCGGRVRRLPIVCRDSPTILRIPAPSLP